MNARDRLRIMIRSDRGSMTVWSQPEIDDAFAAYDAEHRAEVLAGDGQAYDGELAMLRGLVRTLRAVSRDDRADVAQREVRRLLYEHAADERDAYRRESNPAPAEATPDFFQPGHTYTHTDDKTDWQFRVDTVTTHPEDGERTALGWRRFRGEWEPYAYGEDDFEIHLAVGTADITEGGAANE